MTKGQIGISLTQSGTYTYFDPKSIQISYESVQGPTTGRTDDGVLHIDWVRRKIRKWTIEMPPMTYADMCDSSKNPLLTVQGQEYWIEAYDITAPNNTVKVKVYTSNSQADCYSGVKYNGLWQGMQFSAIEV